MALVYRSAGAWGSGKGAALTAAECDGNVYQLDQRVAELEAQPAGGRSIVSTEVSDFIATIHYSDGTTSTFVIPTTEQVPASPITVAGSTLTLGLEHANKYLRFTHSSCVVTLNTDSVWLNGTEIHFHVAGGSVEIVWDPTELTVNFPAVFQAKCSTVHGTFSLKYVGTAWDCWGLLDLAEA